MVAPVNQLEAEEDADGVWRRHVNDQLGGAYRGLFGRIGFLAYLRAPSFDSVLRWRTLQENKLRARTGAGMTDGQLARFVSHYERLTRHLAETLPARADTILTLDEAQAITHIVVCDNDMD